MRAANAASLRARVLHAAPRRAAAVARTPAMALSAAPASAAEQWPAAAEKTLLRDGTRIRWMLLNNEHAAATAPVCVLTLGGRAGGADASWLAAILASKAPGLPLLLWDRPNTGLSSVSIGGSPEWSEAELAAACLGELLDTAPRLRQRRVLLFGSSNGGRMSAFLAASRPDRVAGLVLHNVTAGKRAGTTLAYEYFTQYIPRAQSPDGMAAIAASGTHLGGLAQSSAESAADLAAMDPVAFAARMGHWGTCLTQRCEPPEAFPIAGVPAAVLRAVHAPVLSLYTYAQSDGMHTEAATRGAFAALGPPALGPGSRSLLVSANMEEWIAALVTFLTTVTAWCAQQG